MLVDLAKGEIHSPRGNVFEFSIWESDRNMLLNGLDYIEYTLQHEDAIEAYAETDKSERAWAYLR